MIDEERDFYSEIDFERSEKGIIEKSPEFCLPGTFISKRFCIKETKKA